VTLSDEVLALLRVLPTPTLLVTPQGDCMAANAPAREALQLAERTPFDALGRATAAVSLIGFVEDPEGLRQYLRMCARTTAPLPGSFATPRRIERPIAYCCSGARLYPLPSAEHPVVVLQFSPREDEDRFVLLNQHISELNEEVRRRREVEKALRERESALRDRALEAEALNRSKDEFLATVSHELRTPLNAILGWANLLGDAHLAETERARAAEVIRRNARAQAQLIDELLDMSRIIVGKLRLNVQQIDPSAIVAASIESIRPSADARSIRLQAVLDPDAGPIVGDPDRLQQICWNLLSNAVKFTPKGGRIQIVLERVESSVEICVSDTGRGIAPEFLPYVFDRFRQQDSSSTRTYGGLGLGLSIVKSLVELHGGTVRVESPGENRGATFAVRLPRALARATPVERPMAAVPERPMGSTRLRELEGMRIVAVDDEADSLELLVTILEHAGATVNGFRSAGEGLNAVSAMRPDVLVSDIGMPGEDGHAFIRRVRALPASSGGRTAAVALTAFARGEDRTRALQSGFDAHVPKPVDRDELLAVIASLVNRLSPIPG
jgi:signal transduction histidine kinase/CheY-like chemotaxis protein